MCFHKNAFPQKGFSMKCFPQNAFYKMQEKHDGEKARKPRLLILSVGVLNGNRYLIYQQTTNRRRQIRRIDLTTTMKMMTELVLTSTTDMALATAEVAGIIAPEEAPQDGRSS